MNFMESEESLKQSIHLYLKQRVMPILEPLQCDILLQRPHDIHEFSYLWLQNFNENQAKVNETDSDDEESDEAFRQRLKKKGRRFKCREGVSGEIYSSIKTQQFSSIAHRNKCEQDKIKILIKLKNSIFFKNLSHKNIEDIICCMKNRDYKQGEVVIRQGEIGNEMFLVNDGVFKCEVEGKNELLKIYEPGEAFGELALLYNTKRASTITAMTDGRLYSLDRASFNAILRDEIKKKTRVCEETLNKSELFSTMKPYEKCKLIETIKQISVPAGKYIIQEGQIGDRFYIVGEGKLVAEKLQENGDVKSVYYYKEGDYFGEISLVRNVPRQASIKALTSSKLLYIERSAFKRLLGPFQQLLKRNQQRYRTFKQTVKKNMM